MWVLTVNLAVNRAIQCGITDGGVNFPFKHAASVNQAKLASAYLRDLRVGQVCIHHYPLLSDSEEPWSDEPAEICQLFRRHLVVFE